MQFFGFSVFKQIVPVDFTSIPMPIYNKVIANFDSTLQLSDTNELVYSTFIDGQVTPEIVTPPSDFNFEKTVLRNGVIYYISLDYCLVRIIVKQKLCHYFSTESCTFLTEKPLTDSFTEISAGEDSVGAVRKNYDESEIYYIDIRDSSCRRHTLRGVDVIQLVSGKEHSLALGKDGTVFTIGSGSRGQLGNGSLESSSTFIPVEALGGLKIVQIAAGGWHSIAVSLFGDAYTWGWNESGQIGRPSRALHKGAHKSSHEMISLATLPQLLEIEFLSESEKIISIACGSRHTAFVTDQNNRVRFLAFLLANVKQLTSLVFTRLQHDSRSPVSEYQPFGRKHIPDSEEVPTGKTSKCDPFLLFSNIQDAALPSLSVLEPSVNKKDVTEPRWLIRKILFAEKIVNEEELYWHKNYVVQSVGVSEDMKRLKKILSIDGNISQCIWCRFFSYPDRPFMKEGSMRNESLGEPLDGILIVGPETLHVHLDSGAEYTIRLQFPIVKIWQTKFGIILERLKETGDIFSDQLEKQQLSKIPRFYSLLHPLHEITPVISVQGYFGSIKKIRYLANEEKTILFASEDPSIIVLYDKDKGVHSIWKLRKATEEEQVTVGQLLSATGISSTFPSDSRLQTPSERQISAMRSYQTSPSYENLQQRSVQQHFHPYHPESPSFSRTPLRMPRFKDSPVVSRLDSPSSELSSLNQRTNFGSASRVQSLRQGASYFSPSRQTSGLSPQAQIARSPIGSSSEPPLMADGATVEEPILPDLCLQFLWEEPKNPQFISIPSNKVFLSDDLVGQRYVCMLMSKQSVLCLLRYETVVNDSDTGIAFKPQKYIPAVDAENLSELKMVLVLDPLVQGESSISLYSGSVRISRIVPPNLPKSIGLSPAYDSFLSAKHKSTSDRSIFSKDSLQKGLKTSVIHNSDVSMAFETPPIKSLQNLTLGTCREHRLLSTPGLSSSRRNSLAMPQHPSQLDESVNMLSPVGSATPVNKSIFNVPYTSPLSNDRITYIMDGVFNRVTLKFTGGEMFRIRLPSIAKHPLIMKIFEVVSDSTPATEHENYLHFISKWYTQRNSPGSSDLSPYDEWDLFFKLFLQYMGLESTKCLSSGDSLTPELEEKRTRYSESGSDFDWEYLKSSKYTKTVGKCVLARAGFHFDRVFGEVKLNSKPYQVNMISVPLRNCEEILLVLHFLYEELKLKMIWWPHLQQLAEINIILAECFGLQEYLEYYWMDFPIVVSSYSVKPVLEVKRIPRVPPCIFSTLRNVMVASGAFDPAKISLKGYGAKSLQIIIAYAILFKNTEIQNQFGILSKSRNPNHDAMLYLTSCGWKKEDFLDVPFGVGLPLLNMLVQCHHEPEQNWAEEVYTLISREDLAKMRSFQQDNQLNSRDIERLEKLVGDTLNPSKPTLKNMKNTNCKVDETGTEGMESSSFHVRFKNDRRLGAVCRFLTSSRPVTVALTQRPEVSDHDFLEEQERHLFALCMRTMALPVGRGALSLQTSEIEEVFDPLSIPRLCLSGKAPPRNTTVELTHIDVPANMNQWPLFHNGVAAGLTLRRNTKGVTDSWIGFNRPKASLDSFGEPTPEHAGFLFALGILGHLPNLSKINIHSYLVRNNDMIGVGVILGMGLSKKGSMDSSVLRILAVCIEALTPETAIELNVPPSMTVAAFVSLGWLYVGSGDRSMSEILLDEIGRPPGQEGDSCVERESHALSAGLGLGLVCVGKGEAMNDLNNRGLADTLRYYMIGGRKRPLPDRFAEKYKNGSCQIFEGDLVNTDITGPGATLALGLMYLKSGNRTIAEWMVIPHTITSLESVRPDMLLLRVLARNLILWDEILPSLSWIENHVPIEFRHLCLKKPDQDMPLGIDYGTINQAYCNIVPGACLALGFRFGGSANADAFDAVFSVTKRFIALSGKSIAELAGRATIETALNVMVLSLAMIMAGTGDLEVLRLCRHLRSRVGFHGGASSSSVTYGSHMATHLALGLLFLGGGRLSLSTSNEAIAALICAIYPKFPNHSNDNRYHLQALRHLYVIAAEPRLLLPRDLATSNDCSVQLRVYLKDTSHYSKVSYYLKAPCLLPELSSLRKVSIEDENFWTIDFERNKNWPYLKKVVEQGYLYVKRKVGGSLNPRTLNLFFGSKLPVWGVTPVMLQELLKDTALSNLSKYLLQSSVGEYFWKKGQTDMEKKIVQMYTFAIYRCVVDEKLDLLPSFLTMIKVVFDIYYWKPETTGRLPLLTQQLSLARIFSSLKQNSGNENEGHFGTFMDTLLDMVEQAFSAKSQVIFESGKKLRQDHALPSCEVLSGYLAFNDLKLSLLKGRLEDLLLQKESVNVPRCVLLKLLPLFTS
ncbi:anaphase-promoting complex subunit 1-like isoform X3 [Artemia franciscana]